MKNIIERKITKEIRRLTKEFPVVTILGPRQSGKTTLVKTMFSQYKYFSLEDPDIRELVSEDPRGFLKEYKENVIIDEVQRVPSFFSYLQGHVDKYKKNGSFILTCSHNYLLMENISQSLAGRTRITTLLPLSLEELAGKYDLDLNEYIVTGFYPRIYDQGIRPHSYYNSYLTTYLERDIRLIKNITDFSSFSKFLKLIAGRSGQILNVKKISEDSGLAYKTVLSWLSVLESSYIIYKLLPYQKNINKRVIKSPKIYFYDTGLLCYLLGIRKKEEYLTHYLKGNIFENFIISDLVKYNQNRANLVNFYYYKDSNQNEIDLIIESANTLKIIEIKAGATIRGEMFKNLLAWGESQKISNQAFLIYAGDMNIYKKGIQILDWSSLKKPKKRQLFE